ncbi:MAG: rod shape-determining protein RodA [Spirochaetaceae bacterium]|nr:rod shape-determining protein RodA [Spirochaetaceae bacterium]
MNVKTNLNFDFLILISVISLVFIGVCFIYSSNITSDGTILSNEYTKQIVWALIGLVLMAAIIMFDYKTFETFAIYIYLVSIVLLVITLLFGNVVNGSRRWLGIMEFGIQPSEFAKITTIILLGAFYAKNSNAMTRITTLLKGFLIILFPVVLIVLQPDMGTALVYFPIFLVMSFTAGAKVRHVMYIALVGILTMVLIVIPVWFRHIYSGSEAVINFFVDSRFYYIILISGLAIMAISLFAYFFTKKGFYYYYFTYFSSIIVISTIGAIIGKMVLKSYQIMRLVIFLDPNIDPRGAGWHFIQSITAVGSGGIFGKGFLNGTQSNLRFLPQQSTDFIFSIIAEEIGFMGCLLVFFLFLIIIVRGYMIAIAAKDLFGTNLASGISTMILFHFMVNIGMTIGIMPITGIPLFFISYGGSSLWTAMIGVALLINVYYRRYRFSLNA